MNPLTLLLSLTLLALVTLGCGGGGLTCEDGDFYLDGEKFTHCNQCPDDNCSFRTHKTCTYGSCSGTVTAYCGDQSATLSFSGSKRTCK